MGERGRVLVVEDEELIREILHTVLAEEGYEVRAACDGQEALDAMHCWQPNVIVLDLMMPVMDGWTFRAEQRKRSVATEVPVIVLSGARNVRESAEQLGAQEAIAKPFDLNEILGAIGRAVTRPRGGA